MVLYLNHFVFIYLEKLLNGISDCKRILAMKYQNQSPNQNQSENTDELNSQFDRIAQQSTSKLPYNI